VLVLSVVGCCRGSDGKFELDFESNATDIINSEHHEMDAVYRPVVDYKSEYRRSLRVSSHFIDSLYVSGSVFVVVECICEPYVPATQWQRHQLSAVAPAWSVGSC